MRALDPGGVVAESQRLVHILARHLAGNSVDAEGRHKSGIGVRDSELAGPILVVAGNRPLHNTPEVASAGIVDEGWRCHPSVAHRHVAHRVRSVVTFYRIELGTIHPDQLGTTVSALVVLRVAAVQLKGRGEL